MTPRMVRISTASGNPEGWIRTDTILTVGINPGQRFVTWQDYAGRLRESVVAQEDDDAIIALVSAAAKSGRTVTSHLTLDPKAIEAITASLARRDTTEPPKPTQ